MIESSRLEIRKIGKQLPALVFVSTLLFAVSANQAFAMGQSPSTCDNRYDGTITDMKIMVGHKTYDPVSDPNMHLQISTAKSYTVKLTIHTPGKSASGNTQEGSAWFSTNAPGFYLGQCLNGVGPDQDISIVLSEGLPSNMVPPASQTVEWYTLSGSEQSYQVDWTSPSD